MKRVLKWLVLVVLVLLVGIGCFFLGRRSRYPLVSYHSFQMEKLKSTIGLVASNYVDSVPVDSLISSLIPAFISELDPHSTYFTAEERSAERETMQGSFSGIGVTFNTLLDTVIVVGVIKDGPSDIVGIQAGDRIVAVDGHSLNVSKMDNDSIMKLLKGPDKSKVHLSIYRPSTSKNIEFNVKRSMVEVPQVDASFMVDESLGYIRLLRFSQSSLNDFMKAFAKLRSVGMKALVLDLRDNPGGLLAGGILLSNQFLNCADPIIYTEGRNEPREEIKADGKGAIKDLPLYVLINEETASSSEIFAGAMQDNDRALIIGRRSFGKGLVQRLFEFKDGSSIHLTTARYYTPSGRSIQREYKLGRAEDYNADLLHRIVGGEMYSSDSIKVDSLKVFYTKGQRKVYGGGGIIPDVFVPRDTVGYTPYLGEVYRKGLMQKFAFRYSDTHRELLKGSGSSESCNDFLKLQGLTWQFANYAHTRGVRIKNYQVYLSQSIIEQGLITLILSNIYGLEDAVRATAGNDEMIVEAEKLYNQKIISPIQYEQWLKTKKHSVNE